MQRVWLILSALALLLLSSCSKDDSQSAGTGVSATRPSHRITTYPYVAAPDRRDRILANWRSVKVGASAADVEQLLGQPDEINPTYEQIFNPREVGYSYVFILQRLQVRGDVDDSLLRVHFDLNGIVTRVDNELPRNKRASQKHTLPNTRPE